MNSPIRTSAIGLLQHLQLLYLPSELDITNYTKRVFLPFDCNQTPDPVLPTLQIRQSFIHDLGGYWLELEEQIGFHGETTRPERYLLVSLS
jgi:hypothetical protein